MSFLGSIMRIAPIVLAPATGGTSLAMMAARSLAFTVGQNLIQQLGQRMGLPNSIINTAVQAFGRAGNFSPEQVALDRAVERYAGIQNMSPSEALRASRDLDLAIANAANAAFERSPGRRAAANVKGGWLMAIAEAMGKQLDRKGAELTTMAQSITDKTPSLTTKFQAASQEFGLMMNALTTVLKSVGEGLQNTARKG